MIDQFPDPVRKILNRELEERIATGSRHVVQWISKQQENVDLRTKAGRETFANRLVNDPVVQDWGRLLQLLQRCRGIALDEANPVTELVAFLRRDDFAIDVPSLELTLPDDLRTRRTEPSSSLTIEYTPKVAPRNSSSTNRKAMVGLIVPSHITRSCLRIGLRRSTTSQATS